MENSIAKELKLFLDLFRRFRNTIPIFSSFIIIIQNFFLFAQNKIEIAFGMFCWVFFFVGGGGGGGQMLSQRLCCYLWSNIDHNLLHSQSRAASINLNLIAFSEEFQSLDLLRQQILAIYSNYQ